MNKKQFIVTFFSVVIVTALCFIFVFPAIYNFQHPGVKAKAGKADAIAAAKEVVLKYLKAPSTAKFVDKYEVEVKNNNTFEVTSDFDSQNGFGAMLRGSFLWEGSFNKDGTWKTINLIIDNTVYFVDGEWKYGEIL